jgi:hypothetical protein
LATRPSIASPPARALHASDTGLNGKFRQQNPRSQGKNNDVESAKLKSISAFCSLFSIFRFTLLPPPSTLRIQISAFRLPPLISAFNFLLSAF